MIGKILIIEDEQEIGDLISLYLTREGISVIHVLSGEEGIELLKQGEFDLIVLDLNLPGIDGYEVLQGLRKTHDIPVIIVSARVDDADMILGFGYGADDFVQKPFSPKVLAARIRAHLRREKRIEGAQAKDVVQFGDFMLNVADNILKRDDALVSLSPKEMSILCELARSEGKPISQEELYSTVWGNQYGDMTTVSVHIQRLRKKIEPDPGNPVFVKTVYGFGYMFQRESTDESS